MEAAPTGETSPHRDDLSDAKRRLLRERLRGLRPAAVASDLISPRSPAARIPISAEQPRIWLHATAHPEVPLYNETIHRRGSFDRDLLNAAWQEILWRHEAWRTSFSLVDGEMVQVVQPTPVVDLPLIYLSALPDTEREAERCASPPRTPAVPSPSMSSPAARARSPHGARRPPALPHAPPHHLRWRLHLPDPYAGARGHL